MNKKKLLGSIVAIVAVLGMMGGGTFAGWTAKANGGDQRFTTGTFELQLGGTYSAPLVHDNGGDGLYPGDTGGGDFSATNASKVDAKVTFVIERVRGNGDMANHINVVADGRDEATLQQYMDASAAGGFTAELAPGGVYDFDIAWEILDTMPQGRTADYRIVVTMEQVTPAPAE